MTEQPLRERTGIPERGVLTVIGGIVVIAAICVVVAWLLIPPGGKDWPPPRDFAAPRLETWPVENYARFLARQSAALGGAEGRMPIGEAMARIAARGANAFAPLEGQP